MLIFKCLPTPGRKDGLPLRCSQMTRWLTLRPFLAQSSMKQESFGGLERSVSYFFPIDLKPFKNVLRYDSVILNTFFLPFLIFLSDCSTLVCSSRGWIKPGKSLDVNHFEGWLFLHDLVRSERRIATMGRLRWGVPGSWQSWASKCNCSLLFTTACPLCSSDCPVNRR